MHRSVFPAMLRDTQSCLQNETLLSFVFLFCFCFDCRYSAPLPLPKSFSLPSLCLTKVFWPTHNRPKKWVTTLRMLTLKYLTLFTLEVFTCVNLSSFPCFPLTYALSRAPAVLIGDTDTCLLHLLLFSSSSSSSSFFFFCKCSSFVAMSILTPLRSPLSFV